MPSFRIIIERIEQECYEVVAVSRTAAVDTVLHGTDGTVEWSKDLGVRVTSITQLYPSPEEADLQKAADTLNYIEEDLSDLLRTQAPKDTLAMKGVENHAKLKRVQLDLESALQTFKDEANLTAQLARVTALRRRIFIECLGIEAAAIDRMEATNARSASTTDSAEAIQPAGTQ